MLPFSSSEAELNAARKMVCEIGISHICDELGDAVEVKTNGYSFAVKGVLPRRGCGKVMHLELKQPWLQEQVRSGKVDFLKIPPSRPQRRFDTHHYTREEAKKRIKQTSSKLDVQSSWPRRVRESW